MPTFLVAEHLSIFLLWIWLPVKNIRIKRILQSLHLVTTKH